MPAYSIFTKKKVVKKRTFHDFSFLGTFFLKARKYSVINVS